MGGTTEGGVTLKVCSTQSTEILVSKARLKFCTCGRKTKQLLASFAAWATSNKLGTTRPIQMETFSWNSEEKTHTTKVLFFMECKRAFNLFLLRRVKIHDNIRAHCTHCTLVMAIQTRHNGSEQ